MLDGRINPSTKSSIMGPNFHIQSYYYVPLCTVPNCLANIMYVTVLAFAHLNTAAWDSLPHILCLQNSFHWPIEYRYMISFMKYY